MSKSRFWNSVSLVALAASLPLSVAPARAADQLEEVVVTARKVKESLQETPVAVSSFTPAALEQGQVVSVSDLQRIAPDLSVGGGGTGPSSIVYLAIRGNAQNSPNSATDAAVAIYVDGVYYAR